MAIEFRSLETMASMMFNLWKLFQTGFKVDQLFSCKVNGSQFKANDMFGRAGKVVFVKSDCLPLDADVKSVSIDCSPGKTRGRMYAEMTIFDFGKILAQLELEAFKYRGFEIRGKQIFYNGEVIAITRSQHHFGKVTSPRTMMYSQGALTEGQLVLFMMVADLVYGNGCFQENHRPKLEETTGASASAMKTVQIQSQEMAQEMQRLLEFEQRPLMQLQLYQMANLFHRQKILRMSGKDLRDHVRKEMANNPVLALASGK